MGKIIVSVHSTLDGVFTGPRGDANNMTGWAMPGITDSMKDILTMVQQAEAILIGRVTYEGLSQVWPFQEGDFADAMNHTPKYVATRNMNMQEAQWGDYSNTISLLAGNLNQNIAKLKDQIQGDIMVTSSAGLVQSLINAGLADEISMIIHPVILGSGKRYLENITARHNLNLIKTQRYEASGSIRLVYEVMKQNQTSDGIKPKLGSLCVRYNSRMTDPDKFRSHRRENETYNALSISFDRKP